MTPTKELELFIYFYFYESKSWKCLRYEVMALQWIKIGLDNFLIEFSVKKHALER